MGNVRFSNPKYYAIRKSTGLPVRIPSGKVALFKSYRDAEWSLRSICTDTDLVFEIKIAWSERELPE